MSDNIQNMTDKQLRNEVQLLRDELAIMKRKFEDIIYNLDNDNFSSSIVKEKDNLKAAVKITVEKLLSVYTKEEANEIMESQIKQSAENIELKVSESYESKANAEEKYDNFYSQLDLNSKQIQMTVSKVFSNIDDCVEPPSENERDTEKIYHYTVEGVEQYLYYDEIAKSWYVTEGNSLFSSYTQTDDGFALKGDFVTTTNAGATVKIKGTKIDVFAGEDDKIPKLSFGFDEQSHENIPLVLLGAGDGSIDKNGSDHLRIDGSTVYYGQGVIQKDVQQFIVKLMTPYGTPPGMYITKNLDGSTLLQLHADAVKSGNEIIATQDWVVDTIAEGVTVYAVFK